MAYGIPSTLIFTHSHVRVSLNWGETLESNSDSQTFYGEGYISFSRSYGVILSRIQ